MQQTKRFPFRALLCSLTLVALLAGCGGPSEEKKEVGGIDREYVLDSKMTGYTGIGGDIDGVRNPTLRAKKGERVRITIINGELMAHDVVLEKQNIRSEPVIEVGDTAFIEFEAIEDDVYFCSIPGHREMMNGKVQIVESMESAAAVDPGVSPRKDGRPLNLGFERGNLSDWKASGKAFTAKSVSHSHEPFYPDSMDLSYTGDFYVTSGGVTGYDAVGTLTSESFEITHPWASFRLTGGALSGIRVELYLEGADTPFFQINGPVAWRGPIVNSRMAVFRPVVVDLKEHQGKKMYIRLVDEEEGKTPEIEYIRDNIWSHISFDDFRFHKERPRYLNELRPEDIVILPPRDHVPHAGLSPEAAAKAMTVPEGFTVQVASAEPQITQPIAFCTDDRGRLWVVEAKTYPVRAQEGNGKDRILIFEDTDGNGSLDKRTVFMEGLNLVSGIEVGFGGVWVGAAPYFMYIPIDASGDKPAGEPQILLDGWGYEDTHETLNTFTWGPDGWLYGVHGVFTHSKVGKPGTPDDQRVGLNCGIWRYHPTRHEFEVFAHGTSNPWGIDFNDFGHAFTTNCVIPHLYHIIQNARYHRQGGKHFNQYTYQDIKQIADHVHWMGGAGPHAGNFRSDKAGGGHAHAGAMFYLGNKHWGRDRNAIHMNNIHGQRVNVDHIKRSGSGYMATHGEDFINRNDFWSIWLNFQMSPSGSVYVIDWYDQNHCHNKNPEVHDKMNGRIYRIAHKEDKWVTVDMQKKTDLELVEYQLHENDWYVRKARRILQERKAGGEAHAALWKILKENSDVTRKLRALWALHVTDGINEQQFLELLGHEDEYVRSWAIQLAAEKKDVSANLQKKLEAMSANDGSQMVRLYLLSALHRMKPEQRWTIIQNLLSKSEDAKDQNIPLMAWWALETLADVDAQRVMNLAKASKLPNVLSFAVQRIGAMEGAEALQILRNTKDELMAKAKPTEDEKAALAVLDQVLVAKK